LVLRRHNECVLNGIFLEAEHFGKPKARNLHKHRRERLADLQRQSSVLPRIS